MSRQGAASWRQTESEEHSTSGQAAPAHPQSVLALDPGKDKCGLAVVSRDTEKIKILARRVVRSAEVEDTLTALQREYSFHSIVIGNATTSRVWRERVRNLLPESEVTEVEESGSTLEARELYWQANPPRGWRRVLPLSLQTPPEPIDDFAAVVLAKRFFRDQGLRNTNP